MKKYFILISILLTFINSAFASEYPNKPINLIVAYSAGGGNDTLARIMQKYIYPYLGQKLVVVNYPGAGGQIGFTKLAKAKNDGYTIGLLSSPSVMILPNLRKGVRYKMDDFQAIANIQKDPIILAVNTKSKYKNYNDLKNAIEIQNGSFNISGDGPNSNVSLQSIAFTDATKLKINFVSYSGSGPSTTALLSNEVDAAFLTASSATQFIEAGQITPIAIFSNERHKILKNIPTIKEVSGINVSPIGTATRGIAAPKGISNEKVKVLEDTFAKLLQDKHFIESATNLGVTTSFENSAEFTKTLNEASKDTKKYLQLIKK